MILYFKIPLIDQNISPIPRSTHIEQAVEQYLATADKEANDIYQVFLAELERPLLIATLKHTHGNQSKTTKLLGLTRGTPCATNQKHTDCCN
ncbi:helix-turn-helix domain-containing protein [Moraxella bovoculi]|uniref:helix-turn-helix domain-containing protein n=1 Tax=Moraxella bovoculi TaxID=386891 RepID=UPI000A85EF80|nr:helix-turn-helix domain-containing protein [Moraxella bovoculi]